MDPDNNSPLGPVGPGETITIHSSWMYEVGTPWSMLTKDRLSAADCVLTALCSTATHLTHPSQDNNYDIDDAIDLEITKADTMPPHHTPYSGTMTVKVVEIDYLQRLQMAAVARDAQLNVVTTRRGIGGWMCTDFSTTKVRVTLSPNGR